MKCYLKRKGVYVLLDTDAIAILGVGAYLLMPSFLDSEVSPVQ